MVPMNNRNDVWMQKGCDKKCHSLFQFALDQLIFKLAAALKYYLAWHQSAAELCGEHGYELTIRNK